MGHREPWRAQLAIWSSVVLGGGERVSHDGLGISGRDVARRDTCSANCIAPFFSSWLGNGTSRRGLPVTLSGGPSPSRDGVRAVAGFGVDEDMKAEGPARSGRSAVDGLAGGRRC